MPTTGVTSFTGTNQTSRGAMWATRKSISSASRSHGVAKVAVFAYNNSGHFIPFLFSSDVAANKFGPVVKMTDSNNFASLPPPIAYDSKTIIPNARSEIGSPLVFIDSSFVVVPSALLYDLRSIRVLLAQVSG